MTGPPRAICWRKIGDDDVGVTEADEAGGVDDGVEAGKADLVDGLGDDARGVGAHLEVTVADLDGVGGLGDTGHQAPGEVGDEGRKGAGRMVRTSIAFEAPATQRNRMEAVSENEALLLRLNWNQSRQVTRLPDQL